MDCGSPFLFFFLFWLLSFPTPGCRSHHLRAPSEHLTQWHLCKINKNGTNVQFSVRAAGAIRGADSESAILLGNAPKENLWSVFAPCLQKGGRWARETVDRLLCCLSKFSWLTYTVLKWRIGSEKRLFFLLKKTICHYWRKGRTFISIFSSMVLLYLCYACRNRARSSVFPWMSKMIAI